MLSSEYRAYLAEEMVKRAGFGLSRNQMPQLNNIESFGNFLNDRGVKWIMTIEDPLEIRSTQNEFDREKVLKIKDQIQDTMTPQISPIVTCIDKTTRDQFCVDGHHRLFATKLCMMKTMIPVMQVYDIELNRLMKLIYDNYAI